MVPSEKIRNVALVGHHGAGKSTLVEALLFRAGCLGRLGSIEQGTTVADYEPEEQQRGMSVSLSVCTFDWNGHKINLIDTPGYPDFAGEVRAALRVADLAVFVVDAVDGVQVETVKQWRVARDLGVPRMIFINKLNKERASFDRTLAELRERFGAGVAPIEIPLGEAETFHGVVDLFEDEALVYDSGHAEHGEIPAELRSRTDEIEEQLVEGIVVGDEDLLERYLEGEVPSAQQLEETMSIGVAEATVFPVVCGAATGPIAVDRLANYIVELGPPPSNRTTSVVVGGSDEIEIDSDPEADPLAFVFKTISDPYVGQISVFRVLSGTVTPDLTLYNSRTGTAEKLTKIATMLGKETTLVDQLVAGDIGATSKLANTGTGDVLAPRNKPVSVPPIGYPQPVIGIAVEATSLADEDRLATGLRRLQEEDPSISVEHDPETSQVVLRGVGETHLATSIERLSRRMGIEVATHPEKVRFRESISRPVSAEGKHKKQSGGHGQFGVAMLELEPLPRGAGFEFVDEVKGGAIPRQFIPAVEEGILEAMASGGVHGFPVTDVRVRCVDGKYHSVDSSELSFKMAGRAGFKEGFEAAGPVMLEPISVVAVTVPSDYQGDVLADLASRRGQVRGSEMDAAGDQVISASVPSIELLSYATQLRSISRGWGSVRIEHSHYSEIPPNLVDRVLAGHNSED